jgi:hypothetical protein
MYITVPVMYTPGMSETRNTSPEAIRAEQEGVPVEEIMARAPEGRQPITVSEDD